MKLGGHWGLWTPQHRNTAKKKKCWTPHHLKKSWQNTVTPMHIYTCIVLVWWYRGLKVIILFNIIRFYLKKISETNISQGQNHGYITDAFGLFLLILNFSTVRSMKMKSYWSFAGTRMLKNVSGKLFDVQKLWKREYRR